LIELIFEFTTKMTLKQQVNTVIYLEC